MSKVEIDDAIIKDAVDGLEAAILGIPGRKLVRAVSTYEGKTLNINFKISADGKQIDCQERQAPTETFRFVLEIVLRNDGIVTVQQFLGLKSETETGEWIEHKKIYGFGGKSGVWLPLPIAFMKKMIKPILKEENVFYCVI